MTKIEAVEWLAHARQQLSEHSEAPLSEAQTLLGHVLEKSRAWVLAHPEAVLSAEQENRLQSLLSRLAQGEPLPYLLGHWEFYGMDLAVRPAVLIPRPETEQLVEEALHWLRENPARRRIADVATGSGCISVALAAQIPDARVVATDVSAQALAVALENVKRYHLEERITLVQADLLAGLPGPVDLMCANLPYIPTGKLDGLAVARYEPRLALDGGPQGLDLITRLLESAPSRLSPGGLILLEIEAEQGTSAAALARQFFPQAKVSTLNDLAGLPRIIKIRAAKEL